MIHLILASSSEKLNGFWSPWGPWSSCSGTETGQELRQRICIEPQNGGEPCIGTKNTETRHCGPESGMYFLFKITIFLNVFLRIILLEFQIWHHLLNYFTSSDFNIFLKTQLFSNKYWCTRKRLYYSKNQKMKHKKSDCKN